MTTDPAPILYTAQPVGDETIPSLRLIATEPMPRGVTLADTVALHDAMAEEIVQALCASLPGGTLDRVVAKLMLRIASAFVVRHEFQAQVAREGDARRAEEAGFMGGPR